MLGFPGALFIYLSITRPFIWVPALVVWGTFAIAGYRWPRHRTLANHEGISGLRLPVPRGERTTRFVRHRVVRSVTPWSEIDSIRVRSATLGGSDVRLRLTDGRETGLLASAITRRGLNKLTTDLERLRPGAADG